MQKEVVMARSKLSETLIGREVERLFGEISAKRGDICWNPVTGEEFVYGVDPIGLRKKMAHHALLAREDFAVNGPADAPPLPLEHEECEQVRWSGRPRRRARVSQGKNGGLPLSPSYFYRELET